MNDIRFLGPLLQDFIVPVVGYDIKGRSGYLRKLFGTAFFVGSQGVFVTARHVVEQAVSYISEGKAEGWALSGKFPDGTPNDALFFIQGHEYAPHGLDVAVGRTTTPKVSPLKFVTASDPTGLNVGTIGYPETALNIMPNDFRIRLRMHKGYIQRLMEADDFPGDGHAKSFELSFNIGHGLSGAPLLTGLSGVIGVCVGSHRATLVDYASSLVEDDGKLAIAHGSEGGGIRLGWVWRYRRVLV